MITVEISNRQTHHDFQPQKLLDAVRTVLLGEGVQTATISLGVVDDAAIHDLNRRYLQHDYPTDVLSFLLERDTDSLDGEVIISAETAARECSGYGWSVQEEMLLYVIHGTLHLVGFDDQDPQQAETMRTKERCYVNLLQPRSDPRPDGCTGRDVS